VPRSQTPARVPFVAWVYLALALVGLVSTWTFNALALREMGSTFTPAAFVRVGFEGSPLLGSVAADFWVSASVGLVWMLVEARRMGMRHTWIWAVLTLLVAWAFAFPLFLFVRERRLATR
jgi:hypothetical protein